MVHRAVRVRTSFVDAIIAIPARGRHGNAKWPSSRQCHSKNNDSPSTWMGCRRAYSSSLHNEWREPCAVCVVVFAGAMNTNGQNFDFVHPDRARLKRFQLLNRL